MLPFFPFRKIRRNGKWLLLGVVLILVAFSAYLAPSVNSIDDSHQKIQALCLNQVIKTGLRREKDTHTQHLHNSEDDVKGNTWTSNNNYQPWKPEYKGQVNLHVFEDWCGSSTAKLRVNLHYPLYAHSRSTLKKLAVSPRWTNYGLRIFGYIHPYTDGEFLFAVASDDNCEFWLSMDESPDSLQMCAYVGKSEKDWTAPGEYTKYASQISQPVLLQQQQRYYFELIHKQNAEGTDHVEVAWRLNKAGTKFEIIASESLSLYTNESSLKMSDISHIPQTAASHVAATDWHSDHGADMLREDPRDAFYKMPLLDSSYLRGVLPECVYKPSYIIKGFPLLRYQGLQFVRLTYVYPNDYTRLTHMENDNKCFYQMRGLYLERYGFSRYMFLDQPEKQDVDLGDSGRVGWRERQVWRDYRRMEQEGQEDAVGGQLDYVEDYIDYMPHNSRRLLSSSLTKEKSKRKRELTGLARLEQESKTLPTTTAVLAGSLQKAQSIVGKPVDSAGVADRASEEPVEPAELGHVTNSTVPGDLWEQGKMKILPALGDSQPNKVDTRDTPKLKAAESSVFAKGRHAHLGLEGGVNNKLYFKGHEGKAARGVLSAEEGDLGRVRSAGVQSAGVRSAGPIEGGAAEDGVAKTQPAARLTVPQGNGRVDKLGSQKAKNYFFEKRHKHWAQPYGKTKGANKPVNGSHQTKSVHRDEWEIIAPLTEENNRAWKNEEGPEMVRERAIDDGIHERKWRLNTDMEDGNTTEQWTLYRDSEGDEDLGWIAVDTEVNWAQTFQVMQHNFQNLRSDWIDLNCNVSGNLLIEETEAVAVVEAYMEKLEQKYPKKFSLQRIVNIEKRSDIGQGSRYLLELDLLDGQHQRVRLAHHVYALEVFGQRPGRPGHGRAHQGPPLLCRPRGFQWSPRAAVHFIVPVKNQARWVQKFIMDMEELYRATGDKNFNVIITDYSSTDMDVEQTLKKSHLPKYQYVRLNGNFQRSAGLQAGIDLITDEHSIVFLCDLHIHFPLGFIDSVRRHCVERRMAFAPIVMRLNCGATPQEPDGYWEVNGFGLLGIYKSDLDSIGGMNTRDFTDHWGGEDWELLDRILQAGLEVERIYMRNFFHHYHSRRGMWNRPTFRGK